MTVRTSIRTVIRAIPKNYYTLVLQKIVNDMLNKLSSFGFVGLVGSVASNAAISGSAYVANSAMKGKKITTGGLLTAVGIGAASGALGGSGVNGARVRGVSQTAKEILKTAVSPKKIAMYTAKRVANRKLVSEGVIRTIGSICFSNLASKVLK